MKAKYLIATSILIIFILVIAYLIVYSEYEKVPFKAEPIYELSAFFIMHNLKSDSTVPLRGRLYATFDNNGNCKVIQKYEDKMIFKHLRIPKVTIAQLDSFFLNAPMKLNTYIDKPPRIYDGPSLRLIYKNGPISKILDFQAYGSEIYSILFDQLYELTLNREYETYNDTITIKEMRLKMLNNIRDDYLKILPFIKNFKIE
jgi:hypothetical protein